jgi:hypothetical protein
MFPSCEFVFSFCFVKPMIGVNLAYVSGDSECNDFEQGLPIISPPCKMPQDPQQVSEREFLDASLVEVPWRTSPFTFLPRPFAEGTGGGVDCSIAFVMYDTRSRSRVHIQDRGGATVNHTGFIRRRYGPAGCPVTCTSSAPARRSASDFR